LVDFIKCYNPENRHKRKPTWDADKNPEGRWRKFSYDELKARDKTSLDVFWLRDKSLHLWISRLKAVASDPARANIAWLDRMEAREVQIVTTFGTACARPRA